MSKIVKTTKDGWECSPLITEAAQTVNDYGHLFYEINRCVRALSTEEMLAELREFADSLSETISQAEMALEGVEFETIEECDDDED